MIFGVGKGLQIIYLSSSQKSEMNLTDHFFVTINIGGAPLLLSCNSSTPNSTILSNSLCSVALCTYRKGKPFHGNVAILMSLKFYRLGILFPRVPSKTLTEVQAVCVYYLL